MWLSLPPFSRGGPHSHIPQSDFFSEDTPRRLCSASAIGCTMQWIQTCNLFWEFYRMSDLASWSTLLSAHHVCINCLETLANSPLSRHVNYRLVRPKRRVLLRYS